MPRNARESPVRCPNPKCNVLLILDDGGIIPWHKETNPYSAIDAVCPAVGKKFQPAGKEHG